MNIADAENIIRMDAARLEEIGQYKQHYKNLLISPAELQHQTALFCSIDVKDSAGCFFSEYGKMEKKAEIIQQRFPEEKANITDICHDICNHNFDFLGAGKLPFGEKIKWHRDYRSCYEWPADINFLDMGWKAFDVLVGECRDTELKFPWDVSNLMWLPSLVSAYFLTHDRKYIDAVKNDLDDWIDNNPPLLGVNWFCPMNIAMRAINIIVALTAMFPHFPAAFVQKLLNSLMMHGIIISAYLEIEKAAKRNNHYLANIAGLHYLGTLFQKTGPGLSWLEFAEKELEMESSYQFYPDGTTFEDSTSYHRLSTEMLLICAILGKENHREFSDEFHQQLKRSLNFTSDILPSHNMVQQIGDNDNGRMIQFSGFNDIPKTDHRHLLALGGEFFDDDKLRQSGTGREIEALWYSGKAKIPQDPKISTYSFSYPDGGYYGVKSATTHLLIHNGRISPFCRGGHSHEDQLSLTLSHNGADILVDPGSYRYSSDQQARNDFRSIVYHNTIQINKSSMHYFDRESFGGLWWMTDQANAKTSEYSFANAIFTFKGEIDSYIAGDGYKVSRLVRMDGNTGQVDIEDSAVPVKETGNHDMAFSRFLFGPEIDVKRLGYRKFQLLHQGKPVAVLESENQHTSFLIQKLWFSPEYGRKIPAWQLQICWNPGNKPSISNSFLFYF